MTTTVFSATLATNDAGNTGYSFRNRVATIAGGAGQVRVTFEAHSGLGFTVNNVSIGVGVASPAPPLAGGSNTQATPVELKFSGSSGFAIAAGSTITSDWANLTFSSGDDLVVIIDFAGSNGNERVLTSGGHLYYEAATATYNSANPGWLSTERLAWVTGFNLIGSQSASGITGPLVAFGHLGGGGPLTGGRLVL